MNRKLIEKIFPPSKLNIKKIEKDEVIEGSLKILGKQTWKINKGIVYVPIKSKSVLKEKKAVYLIDKKPELGGIGNILNKKSYYDALLKLPFPDTENALFGQPGYFRNISLSAKEFGNFLQELKRSKKKLLILEIGADTGWACAQVAKLGHQVIGLDINHHLEMRDFWQKNNICFDCVQADMNHLPFKDGVFDLVFASAAIHHTSSLENVAQEIWRVLKPKGQFSFLGEPMKGNWWKGDFGADLRKKGIDENIYSFTEWKQIFKKAGFDNLVIKLADWDNFSLWPIYSIRDKFAALKRETKKRLLKYLPVTRALTSSAYLFSGKKR